MISLVKNLFYLVLAAFHPDKSIRNMAASAGVCLLLSIGGIFVTAWLSQVAYKSMFNGSESSAWYTALGIGVAMFFFTSALGVAVAEKRSNVDLSIPNGFIAALIIATLSLGGFDGFKGFTEGSLTRAEEKHEVQTFEEWLTTQEKPFQGEIDQIDEQIKTLYSDGQKVMYRGKMTTPYLNVKQARKLTEQRDKLATQQETSLEDMRGIHAERTTRTRQRQDAAKTTFEVVSVFVYIIQFLLAIPFGFFTVAWDMQDGVRDGKNALWNMKKPEEKKAGFKQGHQNSSAEINRLKTEIEKLQKQLGNQGEKSDENSQVGTGENTGGSVHTTQREIHMSNSHPEFSTRVQPDKYHGINERKYQKAVKAAKKSLETSGRYNRSEIAKLSGVSRKQVPKYLQLAFDRNDLQSE